MTARLMIGDVRERLAELPDDSVDLVVTSPPFLALRSYLRADHPDKHKEIGSEATPAAFIDTLLALTAEWRRILAPHGSICVELGDTYSGSGGAGGDYGDGGLRDGQPKADGSARRAKDHPQDHDGDTKFARVPSDGRPPIRNMHGKVQGGGTGWPLAKSLTGIPTLYPWSLAYGRNLLTGEPSPAGRWRIRNLIVWARMNPPVGALGDKFRPATSYITVACTGAKRWFDLDAVRTEFQHPDANERNKARGGPTYGLKGPNMDRGDQGAGNFGSTTAGTPPLDWHSDMPDEDGDWLWKLATAPYAGAHHATFPLALPSRLIQAMCPQRVCTVCGKPSERIVGDPTYVSTTGGRVVNQWAGERRGDNVNQWTVDGGNPGHAARQVETLGWSDCGHDSYRPGLVLDPFSGSGTTLAAAIGCGRDAIGIDLDDRNAALTRERCGLFVETETGAP